ncbi:MAG: outer membrane beta-barrel protein [Vicinamibacterales bacterium]
MRIALRQLPAIALIAVSFVFAAATPASAQGFGVKGGWLFPDFNADSIDFENRSGYQLGLFFGGNRDGVIGALAEVNYGKKGTEIAGVDLDVNFLSVPVLLRVGGGPEQFKIYGVAGPQFDWLIDRSLGNIDIADDTEGFELGVAVGGGIEITRFIIELRYVHGLRSIAKDFNILDTDDLKTKTFAILFGFRFN